MGRTDEEVKHPVTWRSCLLVMWCAWCGVSWHCAARPFLVFLAKKGEGILTHKLPRPLCSSWSACGFYCQRVFKGQVLLRCCILNAYQSMSQDDIDAATVNSFKNRLDIRRKRQMDFFKDNVYKSYGCTRVLDLWWMFEDPDDGTRCSRTGVCKYYIGPIGDLSLFTATSAARVHNLHNFI